MDSNYSLQEEVYLRLKRPNFAGIAQVGGKLTVVQLQHEVRPRKIVTFEDDTFEDGYVEGKLLCLDGTEGIVKERCGNLLSVDFVSLADLIKPDAMLPLRNAYQRWSPDAVRFLLMHLGEEYLKISDGRHEYPIHYAARLGSYDIVNRLLDKSIAGASERNADGKLPIELLFESTGNQDSYEYVEAVWRLLKAYPECLACWNRRSRASNRQMD